MTLAFLVISKFLKKSRDVANGNNYPVKIPQALAIATQQLTTQE